MNAIELLDRITPKNIDQFVGNKIIVRNVRDFITHTKSKKNILCIIGPDGCGKTTLSRLIFLKENFKILDVGQEVLQGKDVKTLLLTFANNNTIDVYIEKKKKIVFVDDLDILTTNDKLFLSKLLSVNSRLMEKGIKVIITTNTRDEKKMNDQTKNIDLVKMYYPPIKDAYVHIMMTFDEHSVPYEAEALLKVVSKCKGNIRQAILSLESTNNELQQMSDETAFKDMNNFEMCKRILMKRYTKNELDILTFGDTGTFTYMIYENIPDELDASYKTKKELVEKYLQMNQAFIDAAMFEDKAFQCLNWDLIVYSNVLKFGMTDHVLSSLDMKSTLKDVRYRFSQLLSKNSHKNMMAKKIRTISSIANVSNQAVLNAADLYIRDVSTNVKNSCDEASVLSTYEKNFVE